MKKMLTLENGLILRTANADDVERVAAFNGKIHGELVETMTSRLFLHHPNTHLDDLIFVEDEQSGEVVSSLCLIPWTWRCEDVEIPAGEMGIVGTLEGYRGRGLIRKQVEVFKQRLRERGCLLSQIQGIPYYYRQFGYEYALPLEPWLTLQARQIPDPPEPAFTFRQAALDDVSTLVRLYDEAAQDLAIHAARDEAIWRYLLANTKGTEMERDTLLIQYPGGQTAGYACIPHHHFGEDLNVNEVSRLSYDAALATLQHVKQLCIERQKPGIRLNLALGCTLAQVALSLGGRDDGAYAWQIHVPDVAALLRALAPVLERRVAASPLAGLTQDVRMCLYRETIRLRFAAGKVTEVANVGFTTWHAEPIRFPPLQFVPLVLGYRTWQELKAAFPDVDVAPGSRLLVDTLFPKTESFIYTVY
ncbi:MAG: GNAT family N-acetyltransferase [Anaerolineae bacterium]|nr:GNAT family N-acetyltransferase [Anaerolineae bacterium]